MATHLIVTITDRITGKLERQQDGWGDDYMDALDYAESTMTMFERVTKVEEVDA